MTMQSAQAGGKVRKRVWLLVIHLREAGAQGSDLGEAHEGSLRHHHGVETTKTSFPPPPSLFPLRGVLGTRGCLTITFIRSWGILQMLNITDEHYRMLVM